LLAERYRLPHIKKSFFAILPTRQFPNRVIAELFR
jgi:hypothetical protein